MATLEQFAPPAKAEVWQGIADAKVRANHIGPLNWAWAVYGGTANAITLAPAFARTAYVVGDEFRFRATATNTGATTINVGGLGVKAAVTVTGEVLPSGYIRTDVDTVCVYDGTQFVVQREVELGTNANGTYIKHANGLMECWGRVILPLAHPASSATWTFPSVFTLVQSVVHCVTGNAENSGSQVGVSNVGKNGVFQGALSNSSVGFTSYEYAEPLQQSVYLNVCAKGRWK